MNWTFTNPVRIHFGAGTRSQLHGMILDRSVLLVTTDRGHQHLVADPVLGAAIGGARITWYTGVTPNPGLHETQAVIDQLSGQTFDLVLAFGGGSVIDSAKALAAALVPGAGCCDLAELIGDPGLIHAALPILALPTTAGTGAEVTPFATLWDHRARRKLSLASRHLFPQVAITDPELTHGLPAVHTFSTGLDALNQAFESVWNRNATPLTLGFAGRAIGLALAALPRLSADIDDREARALMAEASLLAGLAISQTRTAICHAISYPLTAHFGLAHGWACAATMDAVLHSVLLHAPQNLAAIAPQAGFTDAVTLAEAAGNVMQDLQVKQRFQNVVSTHDALLVLMPEMVTPGRSDNFILNADRNYLRQILMSSIC